MNEQSKRGSGLIPNQLPQHAYDGPPDYREVGRHGMFPETTHDEIARLNFLAQMNRHLAARVMPFVKTAWEKRALPALLRRSGGPPADRHQVRAALLEDPRRSSWRRGPGP